MSGQLRALTMEFFIAGFLKKMVQGTRASLAQMAVEAEGSSFFEKFAGMFEGKTAEQEFRIKLAFEEGVYGQELEDMMRERAAKGLAGGLATIRGITSGLITAGQPTEQILIELHRFASLALCLDFPASREEQYISIATFVKSV